MVFFALVAVVAYSAGGDQTMPTPHRIYTRLIDPPAHPDYARRHVKPPSWETFDHRTQFACLRGFGVEDNRIVGYVDEIEKYTETHDLGTVIWPSYPIVFAENLGDLADEIARRGLFLFDIWGYVPGSGPGGYWQQYRPPQAAFDVMEATLGDHWLGMDIGEQDGRYVGGYAEQMHPISEDRVEQYLNFQRHFERMGDELGNKLSTLVSLNFGHYFLKEGLYTTIGAETAQGLPNGQVYYAFIRAAGKQYGVPWFGNASVWNRWGYKVYGSEGADHGPTKGTSLNLLKRLLYSHILYNCLFVGFESSWFDGDALSPVGQIQQAAHRWVRENGQPGVMMTPVAVLTDFFAGWTFPRHLYSGHIYRVWGNIPYAPGDYLTDGVLDLLYPGYQDASYFHDETGFIAPTPYGDIADCLLTDAPGWLLDRYAMLVLTGPLDGGVELRDKLLGYVGAGGHLVMTAGNLAAMPGGIAGVTVGESTFLDAGTTVAVGDRSVIEDHRFALAALSSLPEGARVLARCGERHAVVEIDHGAGTITIFASPFGVADEPAVALPVANDIDASLAKPFPLLNHVRVVLDGLLTRQRLFEVGDGLSFIVCRKAPGDYTLGVCNNSLGPLPLDIRSCCGDIEGVAEIALDQSEKGAPGYLPEVAGGRDIGVGDERIIAGGDVRLFSVRVREEGVVEIPDAPIPPAPHDRALCLGNVRSLREAILSRPTFFEHFDGVVLDWRYLDARTPPALAREAGWIGRQGVRVYVDLTSGLNLFPDLRLIDNDAGPYSESMDAIGDVIAKTVALGSRDVILSLHRTPENNFSGEQTHESFVVSIRAISERAAADGVRVYLRTAGKGAEHVDAAVAILDAVAAPNLCLAPSLALLVHQKAAPEDIAPAIRDKVGLWLASAPAYDINGTRWSATMPCAGRMDTAVARGFFELAPEAPIALDGVYPSQDSEYLDAQWLDACRPRE